VMRPCPGPTAKTWSLRGMKVRSIDRGEVYRISTNLKGSTEGAETHAEGAVEQDGIIEGSLAPL
jgi:hypothetical protein